MTEGHVVAPVGIILSEQRLNRQACKICITRTQDRMWCVVILIFLSCILLIRHKAISFIISACYNSQHEFVDPSALQNAVITISLLRYLPTVTEQKGKYH